MAEFIHMGGYAFFVWTSYAVVLVCFVYAFLAPIGRHRRMLHELERTLEKVETTTGISR